MNTEPCDMQSDPGVPCLDPTTDFFQKDSDDRECRAICKQCQKEMRDWRTLRKYSVISHDEYIVYKVMES